MIPHSIEILESRIAPAAIYQFTDVDGDIVTVKTSKGTNDQLKAIVEPNLAMKGVGFQLQKVDISADIAHFFETDITVTAKPSGGGDGFVNVGYIDATADDGDGQSTNLGKVTVG